MSGDTGVLVSSNGEGEIAKVWPFLNSRHGSWLYSVHSNNCQVLCDWSPSLLGAKRAALAEARYRARSNNHIQKFSPFLPEKP